MQVTADIVNPYDPTSTAATLAELGYGLGASTSLLINPIVPTGNANFDLGTLSVKDALFDVSGVNLEISQPNFADLPTVNLSGGDLLDSLAGLDIGFISAQLSAGIGDFFGNIDITAAWNDLIGTLPTGGDIGDLIPDVNFLSDLPNLALGDGALHLLQDIPALIGQLAADFGLNVTANLSVDEITSTVTVELHHVTGLSSNGLEFGLSFGDGLGAAIGGQFFAAGGEFAGDGAVANVDMSAELNVAVQFDVSTASAPQAYVLDSSAAEVTMYINDQVSFAGAVGILGAEFNGSLVVAGDAAAPNPADPARVAIDVVDDPTGRHIIGAAIPIQFGATGEAAIDYEFTHTPNGPLQDHLQFSIGDLNDAVGSLSLQNSPSFQGLIDGLDLNVNLSGLPAGMLDILGAISDASDQDMFGLDLPVVGNLLSGKVNFIAGLHAQLQTDLGSLTQFDRVSVETHLQNFMSTAFGLGSDAVVFDVTNPDDIRVTLDFSGVAFSTTKGFTTNLGFPALGAELNGDFDIEGTYNAVFTFGIDALGVYLVTDDPVFGEKIGANLDVSLNDNGGPLMEGKLGFVAVEVENAGEDTIFYADFGIDITEPSGDGKLYLSEAIDTVGSMIDTSRSQLEGGTGPRPLVPGGDGVPVTFDVGVGVSEWAPSLSADLVIDWQFDGFDFKQELPHVEYQNVRIDVGQFVNNNVCPFVNTMNDIIEPFSPVVDILQTEIPILSQDLLSLAKAAADIADQLGLDSLAGNVTAITTLVDVIVTIQTLGNACDDPGSGEIFVGDLNLQGLTANDSDVDVSFIVDAIDLFVDENGQLVSPLEQFDTASPMFAASQSATFSGGGVEFPLLEAPTLAFEWLLGKRHVPIITLDVARFDFDMEIPLTFQLGPVIAGFEGSIEFGAGISLGYDTAGFSEFFVSKDKADLVDGFYISDTANADGTGEDTPELEFGGGLALVAGVGLKGVNVAVKGGLYTDVGIDLLDHNNDGLVRGKELLSPKGCMRIDGSFGIEASVELKAGPFEVEFPFGQHELASFGKKVYCGPVTPGSLAELDPTSGELLLFVGPEASRRSADPDEINETFEVTQSDSMITVSAYGESQSFDASDVTKIVADAADGNDTIIIDASVTADSEIIALEGHNRLLGGSGGDTFITGDGDDIIEGGDGDDIIETGDGLNVVIGGEGTDTITGGRNEDYILGDGGVDTIRGEGGGDFLFGGSEGDFLYGGSGEDYIDGEGGDDTIEGNEHDDQLLGSDGIDTIHGDGGANVINGGADIIDGGNDGDFLYGGPGADLINGGDGSDTIEGGSEADTITGGGDGDTIEGGDGADIIEGNEGNDTIEGGDGDDFIEGGPDTDFIHGDDGADTIYGDGGEDDIFGDAGDDLLYGGDDGDVIDGGLGSDTIEGGSGGDTLSGAAGKDFIYGGPDNDIIEGGFGNDELYGQGENDRIWGNSPLDEGQFIFGDSDLIYAGSGNDTVFGGSDNDLIYGETGNDWIEGNDGDDEIFGGAGADELHGGAGTDLLLGEWGDDTIRGGFGADVIRGMTGNDTIYGDDGFPQAGAMEGNPEDGDDEIFGDDGDDTIYGEAGDDVIEGGAGNDLIHGNQGDDIVYAGVGHDKVYGNEHDDLLFGHEGNDVMYGGDNEDEMYGHEGLDVMYGEAGIDVMHGNEHNDTMRGGSEADEISGDDGDDLIIGNDGNDTIWGRVGNDVIYGSLGDDIIFGNQGNDRILGEEGADQITGNEGHDSIEGGPDNDRLVGDIGNDTLHGDGGIDTLEAGPGDDYLWSGSGVGDVLRGGPGNDTLLGSDNGGEDPNFNDAIHFGDVMSGGEGNDFIVGLGGADRIDAGTGNDEVHGGEHGDFIVSGPGQTQSPDDDVVFAGNGADQIRDGSGADELNGGADVDIINAAVTANVVPDGVANSPTESLSDSSSPGAVDFGGMA